MPDPTGRDDLRRSLRPEELLDDGVVVVRGGPATMAQLARHARRTAEAFDFDDEPLTGVSVFCALDDIGAASLDALLDRFSSYRVVYLPTAGRLAPQGSSSCRPSSVLTTRSDSRPAGILSWKRW